MAEETAEGDLAAAREALRTAACAADGLAAIATMIDVAAGLQSAEDEGAARADEVLAESISYLRTALTGLPDGGEDHLAALYLLAEAGLLRASGPGPGLDDAIDWLRRLRAALPAGTPDQAETEAWLGDALLTRGCAPGGALADLDEAGVLLEAGLERMEPGRPERRPVAAALALQRAGRFALHGGVAADCDAAVAFARMCLAPAADGEGGLADGGADAAAGTGHLVTAWMALSRRLTAAQRSTMARGARVEAARSDAQAAASLLAELGTFEIAPDDAVTALDHLRRVPAAPDGVTPVWVPLLWLMALLASARAAGGRLHGDLAADASRVAAQLAHAAAAAPPEAPERGELLAMRAVLLAAAADASGDGTALAGAAGALTDAAAGLPAGHLLRSPTLDVLGVTLGRQVSEAASAGHLGTRLAEIADAMDRMPHDDPAIARAMTTAGIQLLSVSSTDRSVLQQDWLVSRVERLVSGLDPHDPLQPLAQFLQTSLRFARANLEHRPDAADAAIAELTRIAEAVPAEYAARPYLLAGLGVAYLDRHAMGGQLQHLERAEDYLARAFAAADPAGPYAEGGPLRGVLLYLRGHVRVVRCYYDRSLEGVTAAIDDLERAAAFQGLGQPLSAGVAAALQTARAMRDDLVQQAERPMSLGAEARDAFDQLRAAAEQAGRENPEYPVLAAQAAGGLMLRGLADHDINLIDQAIRMLAEASQAGGLAVRERPRLLEMHGQGLLTRYELTRVPSDLSNAIDRLEEARRAVEQEIGSPHAASVLQTLASAYRARGKAARGDVDRAASLGLAGLREHAGDVFLQDSDENALRIARRGTSDATEMARWFLRRGRAETAISAIELGRGMVLHAATSGAGVEQALREAGHPGLADEWAAQAGQPGTAGAGPDGDLRYRVMLAVEQSPAEARWLSPPSAGDIAVALRAAGADALVYLLPRDDAGPGLAVIVGRDGAIGQRPLPGLVTGNGSPVGAFLRARRAVEAASTEAAAGAARRAWLPVLGTLCEWAWQVAVGPLLDAVPARTAHAERRIVLVPAGELGLVPWHAAGPGHGPYACQRAVFSYASSARQFAEAARRRPRPWGENPVLISDAAESLYLTAIGVAYLQGTHYPGAAVFGYARDKLACPAPGTPAATRDDVLRALPRPGHPGASLLHFGCHGHVQVPVLGSSLTLGAASHLRAGTAGNENEKDKVQIRDILRQARSAHAGGAGPAGAGGLAVLAACLTDVTERDFDEALTLAAAFLSAGAAGVVAARWEVGDAVTALFMNVFHHLLNTGGRPPADALREAQLWMLDPDREVPGAWPRVLGEEAAMAGSAGGPDLASPAAWAGFTYQGR